MNEDLKVKSKIAELRERFAYNRLMIQRQLSMSELDYNHFEFECGMEFIDVRYSDSDYAEFRTLYLYDVNFWNWWKAEWKDWEQDVIWFYQELEQSLTKYNYSKCMRAMILDNKVEKAFINNYIRRRI